MPYIYKIINSINEKVYVGKTIRNLNVRFSEHLKDCSKKDRENKLYRAMNKYGKDKFSINLIEEVEKEKTSERERYWIKELNSYYNGYNSTFGGEGESSVDEEKVISLYLDGLNQQEVSQITGHSIKTIHSILKRNNIKIRQNIKTSNKKVMALSEKESYNFNSLTEAAKFIIDNNYTSAINIKGVINKISLAKNGKRQTAYGFNWKEIETEMS